MRVLMIAYHFPPSGGAGVQRSVKLVRYLPEHGVEPEVVTRPAAGGGRWTPTDASLGDEVPASIAVHRVAAPEPPPPGRLRGALIRNLRAAHPFRRWWIEGAADAALRAAAQRRPDLVYASLDPYESAACAARVAGRLGVPWVADLRDPWALDEMRDFPSALHRRLELRRMGAELASAAAIVMNTPEARRALLAGFPALRARRVEAITNGFDAADFAGPPPVPDPRCFRIVHAGYLHTALGLRQQRRARLRRWLGGQRVPTDVLTRSHHHLLSALERWRALDPQAAGHARLVLAGVLSESDRALAARSAVADLVELPGALDHAAAVACMRGADLLFLPMHNLPMGERSRIVPGKTYEYLAAGPPILAAVPDGDARDFLLESGCADVCRPDDVEAMLASLRRREAQRGAPRIAPPPGFLARFERRELARRMAELFRSVAAPAGAHA